MFFLFFGGGDQDTVIAHVIITILTHVSYGEIYKYIVFSDTFLYVLVIFPFAQWRNNNISVLFLQAKIRSTKESILVISSGTTL